MKKWSEVASSPAYLALPQEDRDIARKQYFDEVVAPRVDESDRELAWSQFNSDTAEVAASTRQPAKDRGFLGAALDFANDAGAGVNSALKGISDVFGADNKVSRFFAGNVETLNSNLSDQSKAEDAANAEEMRRQETFGDKFVTGAKQAAMSPGRSASKAVGFVAPAIATAGAGAAAGLGRFGIGVVEAIMGSAQGAGAVKGGIYDAIESADEQQLLADPEYAELSREVGPQAARKVYATRMQSYAESGGKIALGAAVGAATGASGMEGALAKALTKDQARKELVKQAAAKQLAIVPAKEVATEVPQEMLETTLANTGAGSRGADIDPMQGVAEAGGQALVMGPMAGGVGAVGQVSSARRQLAGMPSEAPVDASTVLDKEGNVTDSSDAPLALPAPRVIVNPQGQAIREGSGKVFDEPAARTSGRADIQAAMQDELMALGLDPTQRATPTPIAVGADGVAVTDGQALEARQAQALADAEAAAIDPPANVVGRAPVRIDPLTGLPFEPGNRATPTPIEVDQQGVARTDEQRAPAPVDNTIEPPANVVGREPIREAVREELRSLGLDPTQRATPTPIRADGEGTARTDGDTRSVAEATQSALEREAATLYPNSKVSQREWVQAETERQLGMDQRMRDLAERSNEKKRAKGLIQPAKRTPIQRDLEATAELGVVRRREADGTTSYFFATQPDAALVVRPEQGMDGVRKVESIAGDGQSALLRAALADGPIDAGPSTLARGTLRGMPGVATDRFGRHRLIGRDGTRAQLEGELNRQATAVAADLAEKKLESPDDMEIASRAIMNDPRAASSALRSNDIPQVMERLRQIAGAEGPQEVGSTDGQDDAPQPAAGQAQPAVRRSGSGDARSTAGPGGERAQGVSGALPRHVRGKQKADAVSVVGVHYSNEPRERLDSSFYGSGLNGAERKRLGLPGALETIKRRIYFYIRRPDGSMPERESGVGGQAHRVELGNIYDQQTSAQLDIPSGISDEGERANAFEAAVAAAGYDGYLSRTAGQAVLLGQHDVAVQYVGDATAGDPLQAQEKPVPAKAAKQGKIALMSAELRALEPSIDRLQEMVDGVKLRSGTLTFPADQEPIVRAFMAGLTTGDQNATRTQEPAVSRSGAGQPRSQQTGDGGGRQEGGRDARGQVAAPEQGAGQAAEQQTDLTPLPGAPVIQGFTGPDPRLVAVADQYAQGIGIKLERQPEYVKIDEGRAKRIADAYAAMAHAPQDPAVQEAYENLTRQAVAQYQALVDAGYKFWFVDLGRSDNQEYVSTPWNAMRDIRANQTMGVFPTDDGFGSGDGGEFDGNPLLAETPFEWPVGDLDGPMKRVLANDIFRAVHDAFGHGLEGSGFRAQGEENAWQAHARLFTGSALGALTSETRGQNSWLNYGPHGEHNRTAKTEDTIFADQKTGLMPEWTWQEGFSGQPQVSRRGRREMHEPDDLFGEEVGDRGAMVMNWIIQAPTDARKALGLPSFREARSITKRMFAEAVDKYRRGRIRMDDRSPKAVDRLSSALAEEVQWYVGYSKDSGIDWYGTKFQRAVDELAKTEPSLKERENRGLFTALLAITSDGTEVQENLNSAMAMYQSFLAGQKLADSTPGKGKYESSYQKNAELLDDMIDALGLAGTVDFLLDDVYAAEAKAEVAGMGEKSNINDYPDDARVPRAAVYLGPKLGAFYANLMGNTGYLTMDRWWNRTINRYRGQMAPTPTDSSLERLREMIGSDLDDEKLLELAQQIAAERQVKYKEARGRGEFYPGSEIEKLATTIDNNARKELNDSPLNKSDRAMQIAVVKDAQRKLRERGIVANVADIQATIWYYEKELFEAIGVKGRGRISYEEAARNWNDRRGGGPAQGDGRDAAGQKAADAAARPGQVQSSLFDELEVLRSRAQGGLSAGQWAPQVSRRGPGLATELAALAGGRGRSPEALVQRLIDAASDDAGRRTTARALTPEPGSRADAMVRDLKERLDIDLVLFDSNDDAMPLGASVREIPDAIFVQGKAARPEFIVGHELLHELRKAHPDLYDGLVAKLREHAQSTQANADAIINDYREGGFRGEVGQSLIEEENLADVAGQAFADPAFWSSVEHGMEPSKLKQLFRWLARWLGRLIEAPKVKRDIATKSGLEAVARDMREDIAQAYAEMGRRNGAVRSLAADAGLAVKRTGRAKDITDTDAFKRWFGGSKVVDNGRPVVVYTGTSKDMDFKSFKMPKSGVWFTTNPEIASTYALDNDSKDTKYNPDSRRYEEINTAARVIPAYLKIENPHTLTDEERSRINVPAYRAAQGRVFDEIRARGHDGIDFGGGIWVVLKEPTQIKSAIGNNGDFDPKKPDILRSGRGRPVADWDRPERSASERAVDSAVLGASAVASPVTATMQAVNDAVDRIAGGIAKATGVAKVGQKTIDTIRKAVDARTSWNWVERVKQGLVSDFGLPEEYLAEKTQKQARENKQLRAAGKLLERMSSLGPDQLAVAHQWLQEKPDTAREAELMAKLSPEQQAVMKQAKADIDALSREALALGLISQETYDRNAFAYVHRSYKKYELELTDSQLVARQRAQRLKGDQFKGRGMELAVNLDRIRGSLPDELMGLKVEMFEKRDDTGKLVRREFVRAGEKLPLQGYTSAGTWEVRGTNQKGQIRVWRDFTLAERQRMGEIEDARYSFARTMLQGVRDVETARFLDWVGQEYARDDADGLEVVELQALKQALGTQTFTRDEWVQVPETKIKGTKVNRYGALAGRYVPGVMWNDLMAMSDFQNTTWDKMLSAWKISKTALSPAVHVNNVMSNFIMADLADVGVNDIRRALNVLVQSKRGDAGARDLIERYQDSGAEAGSFAANEMKTEVIEPLLKQIVESEPEAVQKASLVQVVSLAAHGKIGEAAVAATKTLPGRATAATFNAMLSAYQSEDSVFRLAKFIKELESGASDVDAGQAAKEAFLDYNINAPWVRSARRSVLPFVSFTYRAVPLLAKAAVTKPWKFAKYYALGNVLAMLAYGMLGDDGDEEREQRLLPEDRQGRSILGLPKMVRLGWNDKDNDPLWLDVRRWLPGADVAETGNSKAAIALPSWLSIGGPLSLMIDFYSNTNFNGDQIVKETDTAAQKVEKVADMAAKFILPNVPLPGIGSILRAVGAPVDQGNLDPYAWASLERTYDGAKSITGKTESMAVTVPNVLGVKLDSRRLSEEVISLGFDVQRQTREIKSNITKVANQGAAGKISREEMQRRIKAEVEKLTDLGKKTAERAAP